jgi:hypothetical protein
VWDTSEDADPYPYEVDLECFFGHYAVRKPHLLYKQDYSALAPVQGNTIVHRLVGFLVVTPWDFFSYLSSAFYDTHHHTTSSSSE